MKSLKAVLAALFVLGATQPLWAQQKPDQPFFIATTGQRPAGPDMGMGLEHRAVVLAGPSPFMMLLKAANLTPAQQAQIRQVMKAQAQRSAPTIKQLRDVEEQISSRLLSPDPLKPGELMPLEKQAAELKQQMDQSMIDTSLAIRNILTSDQLKHLAQVRQQLEGLRKQIENLMGPGPADMMYMPVSPPP